MTPEEVVSIFIDFLVYDIGSLDDCRNAINTVIRDAVTKAKESAILECARICAEIQDEANDRHEASYDPGEGSDGARRAAEKMMSLIGVSYDDSIFWDGISLDIRNRAKGAK